MHNTHVCDGVNFELERERARESKRLHGTDRDLRTTVSIKFVIYASD